MVDGAALEIRVVYFHSSTHKRSCNAGLSRPLTARFLCFSNTYSTLFVKLNTLLEGCPRGRRCSTRNAVWGNSPRVRIPNPPPEPH